MVSAVCHFPSVQSAVEATVAVMQASIPVARIGQCWTYCCCCIVLSKAPITPVAHDDFNVVTEYPSLDLLLCSQNYYCIVSVCLSASICLELHVLSLPIFLCVLPIMVMALSSSGVVAIRYELMTYGFVDDFMFFLYKGRVAV